MIDGTDGKVAYGNIGPSDRLVDFEKGTIITAHPASHTPRPSDIRINEIADNHGGIYSAATHLAEAPSANEEYIKAHIRRLEAMRKAGVSVVRNQASNRLRQLKTNPRSEHRQAPDYPSQSDFKYHQDRKEPKHPRNLLS